MFAFSGALEIANANAWKRPAPLRISAEYLFVEKLLIWAQEALQSNSSIENTFYFLEGGDIHHAMKLSVESGILPQEFFRPAIPFADWDMDSLYRDVKEIVQRGRRQLQGLKDDERRARIRQTILNRVQDRISREAGLVPQKFNWDGKAWTVHQLENFYGMKKNSDIFMMYPQGAWDMGNPFDLRRAIEEFAKTFEGTFHYRQSSWNQIWQYLIGSIDDGLPALLSLHWGRSYHVMNVVGYEHNAQGEVVSFKLKNSWGKDYGDAGYAFFTVDDLQKNITNVWGFENPIQH